MNYTQQDAQDIIDVNTAEENGNFLRLAEKIIQQQDAAVTSPTAIRASIPEEGRVLVFKRAVAVDPQTDLRIALQASAAPAQAAGPRVLALAGALVVFIVFKPKKQAVNES
jgi:hypothetical protein